MTNKIDELKNAANNKLKDVLTLIENLKVAKIAAVEIRTQANNETMEEYDLMQTKINSEIKV